MPPSPTMVSNSSAKTLTTGNCYAFSGFRINEHPLPNMFENCSFSTHSRHRFEHPFHPCSEGRGSWGNVDRNRVTRNGWTALRVTAIPLSCGTGAVTLSARFQRPPRSS
jgi:hypothetical protein